MTDQPLNYKQRVAAVLAAAVSAGLIWQVGGYGVSEIYADVAKRENSVSLAGKAIEFYPNSPDAYYERGLIYQRYGDLINAQINYEKSLKLRPDDYFVWLQLGRVRQRNHDAAGAVEAFHRSVELAPFYGQPRWHLGKLLVEGGEKEQGWTEIRKAFNSDPTLLPAAIEIAWIQTQGNAPATEKLLQLENQTQRLIHGLFLVGKGATIDAAPFLCNSEAFPPNARQTLVNRLIDRQEFHLAYQVEEGNCRPAINQSAPGAIKNGSFEEDIPFSDTGFNWRLDRESKNISLSRDNNEHFEGARSLKIVFNGNLTGKVLRQMVIVEPRMRYRLSFAVQAKDLVTDSYPQIVIQEAANASRLLAVSEPFSNGDWTKKQMEFQTGELTEAVWVSLERQTCRYRSCPIFGTVWIDNLDLEGY